MEIADKNRLFDLRCRSKRGEYLRPEDVQFLEKMWKEHPDEYSALESKIFEATAPFGSRPPLTTHEKQS